MSYLTETKYGVFGKVGRKCKKIYRTAGAKSPSVLQSLSSAAVSLTITPVLSRNLLKFGSETNARPHQHSARVPPQSSQSPSPSSETPVVGDISPEANGSCLSTGETTCTTAHIRSAHLLSANILSAQALPTQAPANSSTSCIATTAIVNTPSAAGQTRGPPTSLWERAIQRLSERDLRSLNYFRDYGTYEDALRESKQSRDDCISKQWKFNWKGDSHLVRDQVDKVLIWVEKFGVICELITRPDPISASIAWGGFRFLLEVFVSDNQKLGAILIGLGTVARLMSRCPLYEGMYLGTTTSITTEESLTEVITKLYTDVLRFLVLAKEFYDTPTAARMMSSFIDTGAASSLVDILIEGESEVIKLAGIAEAEYHRSANRSLSDDFKTLGALLKQLDTPILNIESRVNDLSDAVQDTERTKILQWLSGVKYQEHHLNSKEGRVNGTGEWLLQKGEFRQWQNSTGSTILWLHGIPGAGKTKLTSMVVDTLLAKQKTSGKSEALAYFYCRRDQAGPSDPNLILGAIVKQLSCATGSLPDSVVRVYQARKHEGFSSGPLRLEESLELIVKSLVKLYSQTTIVIDALDECDAKTRGIFLDALKTIASSAEGLVKIFISSRDGEDITRRLDAVPNLYIKAEDNITDIKNFVESKIKSCIERQDLLGGRVDDGLKRIIINTIIGGAHGMFLWADLQIRAICEMKLEADVREKLGQLPRTLENTYSEIYERIISERGRGPEIAKKALMWVLCSCRPFSLAELAAVLSSEGASVDEGTVLYLCHNFLMVDHQLDVVRFAHLSVREFFEKRHASAVDAHTMAAKFCLTYLVSQTVTSVPDPRPTSKCLESPYVKEYSSLYWPTHIQRCLDQQTDNELSNLLEKFLGSLNEPSEAYMQWYQGVSVIFRDKPEIPGRAGTISRNLRCLQESHPLPVLAACVFGFGEKIKHLWEPYKLDMDVKCKVDGHEESILYLASGRGHHWIVKTLIERSGGDANAQGGRYGNLLNAAATHGYEKVVEVLLEEGADLNALGGKYGTALHAAATRGHTKVVDLLLRKGVNVDVKGGKYGNALQAAASQGHKDVVVLLLQKGANVDAEGGKHGNALQAAAIQGHEEVVSLLLQSSSVKNAPSGTHSNALSAAISRGHDRVVKILLDSGVDVNAPCGRYRNAIQMARRCGHRKIAGILQRSQEAARLLEVQESDSEQGGQWNADDPSSDSESEGEDTNIRH